jgi:DNA mismatch repair protein MutS
MQQYREIKARHTDAILFFRMGDFYEMFEDDAVLASRLLGLTLTSRNNGGAAEVPLAGIPVKAAPDYVRRLVQMGHRVAICEQVEDPKLAKGIVRREVIETITPGAAFADDLLDGARNNFLCAICVGTPGSDTGVAVMDVSTGEFRLARAAGPALDALLARWSPRELIVPRGAELPRAVAALSAGGTAGIGEGPLVTERDGWEFDASLARDELARQFQVLSLEGFGIGAADDAAVGAAGALVRYLRELQPGGLPHLARPIVERPEGTMPLDEMTRRNLELVESLRGGERAGTLLDVLDRTLTPMGARLLRQWILAPLTSRDAIQARHDAVQAFAADPMARSALREALDGVRDVERLAGKAASGRATPRELRALGDSLARMPRVAKEAARVPQVGALAAAMTRWDDCDDCAREIVRVLVERPPLAIGDEPTVAAGIDAELDELRAIRDGGKDRIAEIQAHERQRTGIGSLKVGFNKVFGYFIEISNANRDRVPDDYQRRQTLTGAERYVTPALKEYEEKVLGAAERIELRERELFDRVRAMAAAQVRRLQQVAGVVAELDVLASFAEVAEREGYVRPEMRDEFALEIMGGRHPVVERMMPRDKFIPNDLLLTEDARLVIVTGPNMAGKSTILRQVGLVVLMAQLGSFVPASRAIVGIVDRLFTRVGASDNLTRGQSTFMVEMAETSAILHTATARSLVLLDEIGRGTSTWDGLSIAWAVSEHLHDRIGCKTVFATHYHELVQLEDELPGLRNMNVAVREVGDTVLFLHRLQPGGASRSYGIEVGRLAGLPDAVLARAKEVLRFLEGEAIAEGIGARGSATGQPGAPAGAAQRQREAAARIQSPRVPEPQLTLFGPATHPVVDRLKEIDVDELTPRQALVLLAELAEQARES